MVLFVLSSPKISDISPKSVEIIQIWWVSKKLNDLINCRMSQKYFPRATVFYGNVKKINFSQSLPILAKGYIGFQFNIKMTKCMINSTRCDMNHQILIPGSNR